MTNENPPNLPIHDIPTDDEELVLDLLDDITQVEDSADPMVATHIALVHTMLWIGRSLTRIADVVEDIATAMEAEAAETDQDHQS